MLKCLKQNLVESAAILTSIQVKYIMYIKHLFKSNYNGYNIICTDFKSYIGFARPNLKVVRNLTSKNVGKKIKKLIEPRVSL